MGAPKPTDATIALGNRVRDVVVARYGSRGASQCAKDMGWTQQRLSSIMLGQFRHIAYEDVIELAEHLDRNPWWIFTGTEPTRVEPLAAELDEAIKRKKLDSWGVDAVRTTLHRERVRVEQQARSNEVPAWLIENLRELEIDQSLIDAALRGRGEPQQDQDRASGED